MARIANKIKKARLAKKAIKPNTQSWQQLLGYFSFESVASENNLTEDVKALVAAATLIVIAAILSFSLFMK